MTIIDRLVLDKSPACLLEKQAKWEQDQYATGYPVNCRADTYGKTTDPMGGRPKKNNGWYNRCLDRMFLSIYELVFV